LQLAAVVAVAITIAQLRLLQIHSAIFRAQYRVKKLRHRTQVQMDGDGTTKKEPARTAQELVAVVVVFKAVTGVVGQNHAMNGSGKVVMQAGTKLNPPMG
jgi:hypothetical protein